MTTPMTITSFEKRDKAGWPLSMHVIDLGGGELLVHSPMRRGDTTYEDIDRLGRPRILFAPNHFHNMSLPKYREHYPEAQAVAAAGAFPRLERRGHSGIRRVEDTPLPDGARWLIPEGTKSGEAWIALDGAAGAGAGAGAAGPTWIVCDAFFHHNDPVRGVVGAGLRLAKITPGLCIGMTFTMLCMSDTPRYARWVLDTLEREPPARVLFSHGQPLEGPDVAAQLALVVRRRLGV